MTDRQKPSRRDFLRTSTATAAGALLAGGLGLQQSVHAAGSDVIKIALIGAGSRGQGAAQNCMEADPAVRLIAVADAFERQAKGAANGFRNNEALKARVDIPDDRVFSGLKAYEQAIACGADMIVTATPPGFRPLVYSAAIKAGKHIFMEKPCCVDAPGFRTLMEANKLADEKGLKVGVGFQRRHTPSYVETIEKIHDGAIGKLILLRAYWNGDGIWNRRRGPGMTEMQYQVHNWYHFAWLSGDNICEQHIHNLDVCNWAKNAHPVTAYGMGACLRRYLGEWKGTGQIFDEHFVEFVYADGSRMISQCRHIPGTWGAVHEGVHGTKGQSNCNGDIKIDEGVEAQATGAPKAKAKGKRKARGGGVDSMVQEHKDLIAAIRSGEKYNEGYYGATSSMTAVLGRMATYSGKEVKWDEAVEKGTSQFPKVLDWGAEAPVKHDKDGNYPIPVPGITSPFEA